MRNLGYWIIIGVVLVCVLVALLVPIMWVKLLMIGVGVVFVLGAWVWMKMHTLEFIQSRVSKLAKRHGCESMCKMGDFYIVKDRHYYKISFLASGWRVNRAVIDFEMIIPYYDRLENSFINTILAEANEEYEYVKLYSTGKVVIGEYMGMVEYAPDFFRGFERADSFIQDQMRYFHFRVYRYADSMGWIKRDAEGNIINENDDNESSDVEHENEDGNGEQAMHNGRTVVRGLFEHKKNE